MTKTIHTNTSKNNSVKETDWKSTPNNSDLKDIVANEIKFEPYDFKTDDIDGVKIYSKNLPYAPSIHMRIGFRYGALHDKVGKEGIAHFLEHMLFDGSDIFDDEKDTQEFGKVIMLDSLNAYTNICELFITGRCLPHNFQTALKGIFSMIVSPKLTKKSFDHEKKVITQEAWGVFLNQKRIDYIKKERDNNFQDLPDRLRIASALGWPDTIEAITHDDIKEAHAKYFVKENMEIYLAGNIDTESIIEILKPYISKVPHGELSSAPKIPKNISAPKINTFDHTYEEVGLTEKKQATLSITSKIPRKNKVPGSPSTLEELKLITCANLADYLLSDLVFRKLRLDNSWCYSAGSNFNENIDFLRFYMSSTINFNHVEEAETILWQIIEDIKAGKYKDDFEKTKRTRIEQLLAKERLAESILDHASDYVRSREKLSLLKETAERIINVTYEDIASVISEFFTKEICFVEIVRPGKAD